MSITAVHPSNGVVQYTISERRKGDEVPHQGRRFLAASHAVEFMLMICFIVVSLLFLYMTTFCSPGQQGLSRFDRLVHVMAGKGCR